MPVFFTDFLSARQIASQLSLPTSRIRFQIQQGGIEPDHIIGPTRLFGKEKVTAIEELIRASSVRSKAQLA